MKFVLVDARGAIVRDRQMPRQMEADGKPKDPGGKGWRWVQVEDLDLRPWQTATGFIEPVTDVARFTVVEQSLASWKAQLLARIRAKAADLIETAAPAFKQRNALARLAALQHKQLAGGQWSVAEAEEAAAALGLWRDQVDPVREASNAAEAAIAAAATHTLAAAAANAATWPSGK